MNEKVDRRLEAKAVTVYDLDILILKLEIKCNILIFQASNVNKYRVGLRLLAELCIYGIIVNLEEGTKLLISTLSNITNCDMVCVNLVRSFRGDYRDL